MKFLMGTTAEAVDNQEVTVVIDTKEERVPTITALAFLQNGQLFVDCAPALRRKYVTQLPEEAIISSNRPAEPLRYAIFISPSSRAGAFIKELLAAKSISHN